MRFFLAFALLAVTSSTSLVRSDDDLFSEVAMESVFAKSNSTTKKSVAAPSPTDQIDRITGTSGLTQVLKTAGFEPTTKDGKVTFRLEHGGWAFPAALRVDVESDRIICQLSLIEVAKDAKIDQTALLGLLSAGDPGKAAFFAFDREEELMQLQASLSNRSVIAREMANELRQLASFAGEKSELWSKLTVKQPKKAASKPTAPKALTPSPRTPASNTTASKSAGSKGISLVGRWSASLSSTEAFAIQVSANDRFQLANVKAGKSTVSKGALVRNGNKLTLNGDDGTKINCLVTAQSGGFQLGIVGADGKTAVKLNFKKQ
ncbi:MAG: type III secretion system chaperone [Rubripirellula sp.]